MTPLVTFLIGLAIGLTVAAWIYRELWRWARQCQGAYIVIAHKRKVQLQAPLSDWLMWANALNRDEASRGRSVYRFAGASVAIARTEIAETRILRVMLRNIKRIRNARKRTKAPTSG